MALIAARSLHRFGAVVSLTALLDACATPAPNRPTAAIPTGQSNAGPSLSASAPSDALPPLPASSASPPPAPLPEALVLRVDEVVVSPFHPGTTDPWDGPGVPDNSGAICTVVASGATVAYPVLKGIDAICSLGHPVQQERNATSPDLQVRLSTADGPGYVSSIAPDTLRQIFGYEFVLPTAAIPPEGVRLTVEDADAGREPELIGSILILRADLESALGSATHVLTLADDAVPKLEVAVRPYAPLTIPTVRLDAAALKPTAIGARSIIAGEVVGLHASGQYTVGSWNNKQIGPAGYPNGDGRSYNFQEAPFGSAPHGSAIALLGASNAIEGVLIGVARTFTAALNGPLRVGINDTDPGNNKGWISFEGVTRAPTPDEWLARPAPSAR